jgi:hypothetical protein
MTSAPTQYLTLPKYIFERDDDHPDGRHYHVPTGLAGSVTTHLANSRDNQKLEDWKEWKGEEEAAKILKTAGCRGNGLHKHIEDFLTLPGRPQPKFSFLHTPYWNSVYPYIKKIKHSALIEGSVYHPDGYAGTPDHIGYHKGYKTIGLDDWKSADKPLGEEKIYEYSLQVAAYVFGAEFVYKEFGLFIPRAQIVVAIPNQKCQIIRLDRDQIEQLFIHFQSRQRFAVHPKNPIRKKRTK